MKKTTDKKTTIKKMSAKKLEAEKLKKQKKRDAAKAKRLKAIEKRKAQVAANKQKRAEKKAKKLAKLEKLRAKKAAIREAKKLAHQKKLERIAKQKARDKARKLKERAKAKLEKQKNKEKSTTIVVDALENIAVEKVVDALKSYVKKLAEDKISLTDKKIKKLEKLGFTITDDAIGFIYNVGRKTETPAKAPEVVEPEVVDNTTESDDIDVAIDAAIGKDAIELENLANELEEDNSTEVPVGDTFTDNNITSDQPTLFDDEDEDDDTIDDNRDETDEDKIGFRKDWNNEFGDDGERDENW